MWEMTGFLLLVFALPPAGLWFTRKRAELKRRRVAEGHTAKLSVRARGPRPLPRHWSWGSVDTGSDPLVFRRWWRRGEAPLTGLTLLRRHLGSAPHAAEPVVVFKLRDAAGRPVELAVQESDAELFEEVLTRGARDTTAALVPPRRRMPRWRIALAALAGIWLAAWAYLWTAGTPLDALVLENDEDWCTVEWTLDGRTYQTGIDCFGEQADETVRIMAMPPPFRGEAAHLAESAVAVPLLALPFLAPLGLYGIGRLRHRDEPVADRLPAVVHEVDVPELAAHDLRWSTIKEAVERRAVAEEWDVTSTRPWWTRVVRSGLAQSLASLTPGLVVPLVIVAFAVGMGWTAIDTRLHYDASSTTEISATVVLVDGFVAPIPWDVEVTFDENGAEQRVRVMTTREPDENDQVNIRYDAAHDVARPFDDDGTERGLAIIATIVTLSLAYWTWRLYLLLTALRALLRQRRAPAIEMRYAVVLDEVGEPGLLLFETERDLRPVAGVAFKFLPDMPVTGTLRVHGEPAGGEVLVLETADGLLYPYGPAVEFDTADLLSLVNGEDPAPENGEPGLRDD